MNHSHKISLEIPNAHTTGRFFSFRLKQNLFIQPSLFPEQKKIVAISDIEGNFQSFAKLLIKGGVIDKYLKWVFEDGHLIILGDCFDRGESVVECLWLIYSLEEQAKKEGGHVHFILGNHEIMNMNGDWRYAHPKYAAGNTNRFSANTALYDANNELWRWIRTKNIIEKIGPVLFVHGGISPSVLAMELSIEDINEIARPWYNRIADISVNSPVNQLLKSENSLVWYRGFYNGDVDESFIDKILDWFNVTTIITGHSIVNKISGFFSNKVINIDTDHAAGQSEGLLIRNNKFYRYGNDEHKELIK